MELGNSDECCREVDEEERLTLAMVVLREWWALGDSPENAKPGSQWQILHTVWNTSYVPVPELDLETKDLQALKGDRHRALPCGEGTDLETPKDGEVRDEAWKECRVEARAKYVTVDVKSFVNCDEQDENGHRKWQLGQFRWLAGGAHLLSGPLTSISVFQNSDCSSPPPGPRFLSH
ncbi:hypothetical protein MDA_GLEAN10022517 [Myotis davidii]|uniref:Uncharacterized protein n=1 Tax=Myotis davidii TaxID=225400 RepID=L5MDD0_MYODS|nr:hypothetical protein MDA_GLEAN10022517 [Myotis davidii]